MKLHWTGVAGADRQAISEFIAADNPRAALAFDELISERASRLPQHPSLGRPGRVAGTRELVIHANYTLIYRMPAHPASVARGTTMAIVAGSKIPQAIAQNHLPPGLEG